MIAVVAVNLMAHWGIEFGVASGRVVCQNIRFMYSAKIRAITAFPPYDPEEDIKSQLTWLSNNIPGLSAIIAVQANKYETRGP